MSLTRRTRAVATAHAAGDYDRAINLAARASRIDPEDGGLLESLAMLLAEDGAMTSARRAAKRAVKVLREMEITPPEELIKLSERPIVKATRALSERAKNLH